ncbi:TRAF3-interacting protein 1 [Ixodes scapularis]|uniref:TRAF3-interacting protein 1 n=1 Tax=Ixodes scapularis TaxID=6945 RepID=UPI001A9DFFE3|nr:TRAF3-interacting protein 1 [Ixodes scapularis]
MEDEISPKVIKKTQDLLGSVIKKPPLQEKLLKKPPFRFLHDIIHNVIKTSKFLDGLYTPEELTSENIKDKESKVVFLQKAIDVVIMVTGTHLTVRPSKIVSGHEAEKTNEFLQLLAKAASKKLDSNEAVKRVLAGEKPAIPTKPDKKDGGAKKKESTKTSKKPATESDNSRSRSRKATDAENGEEKKSTSLAPVKEKSSSVRSNSKSRLGKTKTSLEHKTKTNKDPDKNAASSSTTAAEESHEVVAQDTPERPKTSTKKRAAKDAPVNATATADVISSEKQNGIGNVEEPSIQQARTEYEMQAPNDIKRPRSTKRSSKQELQTTKDESRDMSNGSNMVAQPDPEILLPPEQNYTAEQPTHDQELERPPTRSSLRSSRPRSSRPAAPRIRKKEDAPAESAAAPRAATAKSVENVILDGNAPENEEDKEEEFVVAEPLVEPVTVKLEPPTQEAIQESEQGSLVKQLLETKKELEQGSQRPSTGLSMTESARSAVATKVQTQDKTDVLRGHIQAVSRGALPLGRLLDVLSEDLDYMNTELKAWAEEHAKNLKAFTAEQSMTESVLEPLRQTLEDLDRQIADQMDAISATKASIFSNAERLEKMLAAANIGR